MEESRHHETPIEEALERVQIAALRLQEARHKVTVSQDQFDQDLSAELAAQAAYVTAVNAYIAAVNSAAPNLATEDAEVAAAAAALATAQAAIAAAKP